MTTQEILKTTKTLQLLYVEDDENMRKSSIELFGNFLIKLLQQMMVLKHLKNTKKVILI